MYAVNLWNSKPGNNDDCITGDDFATLAEAEAVYASPLEHFDWYTDTLSELWIQLDGEGIAGGRVRRIRAQRPDTRLDDWRAEQAMQAGMGLGIQAYNDWK